VTRTRILIAVVATALLGAAFYMFALAPQRKEVTRLDGEITKKKTELVQAQQTLASYEEARKSYKANYATLARLGKAVPADDDVRSLLVQLENAAERSGVDFEKIELGTALPGSSSSSTSTPPLTSTGSSSGSSSESTSGTTPAAASGQLASAPGAVPVAGGALSAMPFSFSFTGGYFDLSNFFAKLEHFVTVNNQRLDATGRLLRLESVAIAPSTAGFPHMQAQIGAATYIVPPVTGVPGAATPDATQSASTTASAPSTPGTTPPTTTATAGAAQ
jgi:Tfp pilus assembly protein PilO